jgi:hypothetical protein
MGEADSDLGLADRTLFRRFWKLRVPVAKFGRLITDQVLPDRTRRVGYQMTCAWRSYGR